METVLFLGAGASVFAGMPTTKDLVKDVLQQVIHREKWDSPAAARLAKNTVRDHDGKDAEVLYQTIRDMIAAEKRHLKVVEYKTRGDSGTARKREIRVSSVLDPDNATATDETKDINENIETLKSLEGAIRNTLLDRLMVKPDSINDVVERYGELFEQTKSHTIVTTNYDNVPETYCEQAGLGIINGFKASHLGNKRTWDNDTWDDDEYQVDYEPDGSMDGYLIKMRLVKLHGSITWQKDGDHTVLEIGSLGLRDSKKDVMILPTLGEKDYTRDVFPELQRQFNKVLARTELLIVAGFSFRDPKINQMLRSRLERTAKNPNPMKMLYMDPRPGGLKELVGTGVEPRQARSERGTLLHYYHDEMPYVYAHKAKFPPRPAALKLVLDILNEVCGKVSPGHD